MKDQRKLLVAGMVAGAALMASPALGLVGTVFGVMHTFHALGSSGVTNMQDLSHSVGITMISSAVGIALFPVGLVLLIICVVFYNRDRKPSPPPSVASFPR